MRKMCQEGTLASLSEKDRRYLKALMEYRIHQKDRKPPDLIFLIVFVILRAMIVGSRTDWISYGIAVGAACAIIVDLNALRGLIHARNNRGGGK